MSISLSRFLHSHSYDNVVIELLLFTTLADSEGKKPLGGTSYNITWSDNTLSRPFLRGFSYGLWSRRWSPLSWIEHRKIFFNVHFQLKADTLINQYNFTFYRLSLLPKGEFKGKLLFVYVLGQFASKEISSLLDFVLHFWWWLREVKAFKPLNHDSTSSLSLQIWSRWIKTRLETTSTNTVLNLIDMDKGEKMY